MRFFKSIRFKLTLLYSLITFLFTAILVISLNIYLNSYLRSDPILRDNAVMIQFGNGVQTITNFEDLVQDERNRIKEIRLEDLRQIQGLSLLSLFPIAIVSFVLGYILSGRFLSPIEKLSFEFKNIQTKDLGKTIPVEIEDEVGELIMSFNDLSTRLNTAFTSQEQFVQDASHELKTPLTVIQTNLDTLVDDPTATKAELQNAIRQALKGMKELRKLTENLLQLSNSENVTHSKIDLNRIVAGRIDALKPYAASSKVKLISRLPDMPLYVSGDEFSIGSACSNVIENGIKYSKTVKNPLVMVELKQEHGQASVIISDNGPGIPKEFQQKIFDRFYRVDKSRSHDQGGFGLGLAIASKNIKLNKGKISLISEPGKTIFTISLPVQA